MNLLIAGDVVPTNKNIYLFEGGLKDSLDLEFKKIWFSSDFRIFNLECPIIENEEPILKYGPNLSCSNNCIKGIKELEPSLILLANNHIKDYGVNGSNNTINKLKNVNISYTGIIDNINSINNGYILEKDNIKVGIYNFSDNEFSQALENEKGVRGISIKKNYQEIKRLKEKTNYLIIVFHGGKEYYQYPTPRLKETMELLIDIGANIVICQHSHCIGTIQEYKNGTIIYGQGNFIFDDGDNPLEDVSLLLNIEFTNKKYTIKYIPIMKKDGLIALANNTILNNIRERNLEIQKNLVLNQKFKDFSKNKLNNYMSIISKKNILNKIINRFFIKNYYIKSYSKKDLAKILNIIECEAHREVFIQALKDYLAGEK